MFAREDELLLSWREFLLAADPDVLALYQASAVWPELWKEAKATFHAGFYRFHKALGAALPI